MLLLFFKKKKKMAQIIFQECPRPLLGNWFLVWRFLRYSLWLEGKRSFVAEFHLGFAVCLPCLIFLSVPATSFSPSLPFFFSSATYLVPASLLSCQDLTLFFFPYPDAISGKVEVFQISIFLCGEVEACLCTPKMTFSNVQIAFSYIYMCKNI